MKKKLIFLGAILTAVAFIVGAYFLFVQPKKIGEGEKTVTLEIVTKGQRPPVSFEVSTNGATLYDMLEELVSRGDIERVEYDDYGSFGIFVSGLHGVYNVAADEMYFALYINGEYASLGCKDIVLSDGDVILFRLTGYNETPDNTGEGNLWIFIQVVGLIACIGLMAYMIVRKDER